jgi:hypothetical protein
LGLSDLSKYQLPSDIDIASNLVKLRLHAKNPIPRLLGSALKVYLGGVYYGNMMQYTTTIWWDPLNNVVKPTSSWVEVGL